MTVNNGDVSTRLEQYLNSTDMQTIQNPQGILLVLDTTIAELP